MSRPEPMALLSLAESIADGAPIDWDAAEAGASGPDRALVRQLRVLSDLAGLHRSLPAAIAGPRDAAPDRHALVAPAIGSWAHLALIERLGGGTFGDVYRAWDRHLEREVALKLLRTDEAVDDLHASRIAREGRLLARVRHANVITVHGVDAHDGRVGLWMELVRGVTLEQQIAASGPLSAREAAAVGIDLCRALAAIHAAGLIHRDVKAQNVMREDGGRIVLMDLGTGREADAAGAIASPDLAGTPLYLAPEIFSGAPASERTDLYSLGVLLYRLVTGAFPVRATTIKELHAGHERGRSVRLRDARADLPTGFVRVIDRAIASDPGQRYATAGAFEADLVQALDGAPSAIVVIPESREADRRPRPEPESDRKAPVRWFAWRPSRRVAVLAAAMVLALLAVPARRWLTSGDPSATGIPGHVSMLAVLPFENLSADAGGAYLANAVPMELASRLGQIGALKVVPWTFVKRFDTPGQHSLKDVAGRTGADAIVEGVVLLAPTRADGSRAVQVRVQVFEASMGGLLWSASFERDLSDFFALQAQVAGEIADRLHVVLASREQTLVARSRQVPAQAMEEYLRARQLLEGQMDVQRAIELFTRATRRAPGFAEAYAGLSSCYALESSYFGSVPSSVALRRALDASNRALALDPDMPAAWGTRAFARFSLERNWAGAESDFHRALELGPTDLETMDSYSNYLTVRGRHAEAIEVSRRAEERGPLSVTAARQVAWAYYMAKQYDDAIQQLRRTLEIDPQYTPAHTLLGRAHLLKGNFAEAIRELEKAGEGYEDMLALGYAMAGQRAVAERLLADILSASYRHPVIPYEVALVYVALADRDRALEWLERANREKDPAFIQIRVDPMVDLLRSDSRFEALRAQLELQP